jgi:hypothetical protein
MSERLNMPASVLIKNKYNMLAFTLLLTMEVFENIFKWRRNYPKILKLITFGRKDELIELELLN